MFQGSELKRIERSVKRRWWRTLDMSTVNTCGNIILYGHEKFESEGALDSINLCLELRPSRHPRIPVHCHLPRPLFNCASRKGFQFRHCRRTTSERHTVSSLPVCYAGSNLAPSLVFFFFFFSSACAYTGKLILEIF